MIDRPLGPGSGSSSADPQASALGAPDDSLPLEISIEGEAPDVPEIDPQALEIPFDANLAEYMSDQGRSKLVGKVQELYESDDSSREEWLKGVKQGLKLLGLSFDTVTQPWDGAAAVHHPLLISAVVAFQSRASKNLFPAKGPALAKVKGKTNPQKLKVAQRITEDFNNILTSNPDYRMELEKAQFNCGLTGSGFLKTWWSPDDSRPRVGSVSPEDLVMSPDASDVATALRVTHIQRKHDYEIKQLQVAGFYAAPDDSSVKDKLDGDASPGVQTETNAVHEAKADIAGIDKSKDSRRVLLEMQIRLSLADFDSDMQLYDDENGITLPYVVTIDLDSSKLLAVRRNWLEEDQQRKARQHVVQFQYIVSDISPYGLGLVHIIGQTTEGATSILRNLIDAGALSNLQAGFKAKSLRVKNDSTPLKPGEFRDAEVSSGSLRDAIVPLPFKEPSATLLNLMEGIVSGGQALANVNTADLDDLPHNAASFAVLALLERQVEPQASVFTRLHSAFGALLRLIANLIAAHAPPQYEYDIDGDGQPGAAQGSRVADLTQFDVVPVSNPNEASSSIKMMKAQALMSTYQAMPDQFDKAKVARLSVSLLGDPDFDDLLATQSPPPQLDPVSENMSLIKGQPAMAYLTQDHQSHITVHMNMLNDPRIQQMLQAAGPGAGPIIAAFQAHVAEHVGMRARSEIEQLLGQPLPPPGQPLPPQIEAQIAFRAAQASSQILAQQKQNADPAADILTQLQIREADRADEELEMNRNDKLMQRTIDLVKVLIETGKVSADIAFQQAQSMLQQEAANNNQIEDAEDQSEGKPPL